MDLGGACKAPFLSVGQLSLWSLAKSGCIFFLWCRQRKVIQGPAIPPKPQLPPPPPSLQTHPQASNPINLSGTNIPVNTKVKGFWKGMVLVGEEQI